jgi:ubiquinone/menaquinone biosynthesis C-methylase UbiE
MNYYDGIAKGYLELHAEEQISKAKIIVHELKIGKNSTVLDVGCGPAPYAELFECRFTGIDPSLGLLKQAKCGTFIKGAAESLPFDENSFDFVISVTAIHNFKDFKKGLNEICRVAKGQVALSILKRSPKFKSICNHINTTFNVIKTIDEAHDLIIIANKKV